MDNLNGSKRPWYSLFRRGGRRRGAGLSAFRRLALQLRHKQADPGEPRSVLVVTPTPSALCARGSAMLSRCLADEVHAPLLLIDAALQEPDLTRLLGCTDQPGLTNLLGGTESAIQELSIPTTHGLVSFLPAGDRAGEPSVTASHQRAMSILEEASGSYASTLISGGSVLDHSYALTLAAHVGCVLLLVIEGETTIEELAHAEQALRMCRARDVGLVLTKRIKRGRWDTVGDRSLSADPLTAPPELP